jgi:putative OPT family oligopeptide transporter
VKEEKKEVGLSPLAYEVVDGEKYPPYVPAEKNIPEFTWKSVIVGIIVGIVFGAANAYLGLKVGMTVSASIPAAVIGVAIFRFLKGGTILETNIVQTIGSAGESLAAGVIFTLPVFYLWGYTPNFWPIFPLALIGGLLGVLFMIPLRRYLIVKEHGKLTYPEGTACAEVLVASEKGGNQAKLLFSGMGLGFLYAMLYKFFHLFSDEPDVIINKGSFRTSLGADVTPELLGVGYIIGPKVSAVMLAGGVIGWLVIIPLIYLFGGQSVVSPETTLKVSQMDSFTVWSRYLRYIGAGAVAFGGIFTLIKSLPVMFNSFILGVEALFFKKVDVKSQKRTMQDMDLKWVALGIILIFLAVWGLPLLVKGGSVGIWGGLTVTVFSFFFVTVSSRIVGLVGSSSNPISGMTIATVLICALLFGGVGPAGKILVLTIGALVCIAAAIAGDTSQDLKTGHLVGATPYRQQIGEIIGVIFAALAMSSVLALFKGDIISGAFKAPQANLIKLVIDGVLAQTLPWALIFIGMALAFCVEIMGLPTLAFAVGLYLPIHLAVPVMIGGLVRLWVEWSNRKDKEVFEAAREKGVLFSSGLIAGAALLGVLAAAINLKWPQVFKIFKEASPHNWLPSGVAFAVLTLILLLISRAKKAK